MKPFVKSNKNDFVDAEAIAEAVDRKNMRFVPIKTDDQLDLQAIHRIRDRLISRRPAVINQLRAFLLERGLVFAKTPAKLKAAMADILENAEADLTPLMRNLINTLWDEWKTVERQVEELNDELERISAADAGCTRIRQIPRIGPVVATAIVAAIGNGAAFRKGREFRLGNAPRSHFPSLRRRFVKFPTEVCIGQQERKNSHNGVSTSLILRMVFNDRGVYKARHARISSWPGGSSSTQRPNTSAQTCLLAQTNPCSRVADHTFSGPITVLATDGPTLARMPGS